MITKNFAEVLLQEFARRQLKNSAYSLRAFAKHLHINPSTLSRLFTGKRNISPRLMEHISCRLISCSNSLINADNGYEMFDASVRTKSA
jgi:plasmid maintenance system antidote protein VapI